MSYEQIDALLYALNTFARDIDPFEYGLPVHTDMEVMQQIVLRWLGANK